jgi:hypothetical protein
MNALLSYACAAALAASALPHCFAQSPWDGTWKGNAAKSKLTGETITYTAKDAGAFHYSNGSTVEYDFACDGKPYPFLADRTVTCTGSAADGYDFTYMAHGTILAKSHRTFSSDGTMMMIHGTASLPDGTSYAYDETFKRTGGGKGLAGKWLDVKDKSGEEAVIVITIKGDMLHIEEPGYKEVIDAKLDGSDGTVTGPTVPPGSAVSYKAESPTKMHFTFKINGKVIVERTYTLSADGKSYTAEEWVPGKMSEKATLIYEKQ